MDAAQLANRYIKEEKERKRKAKKSSQSVTLPPDVNVKPTPENQPPECTDNANSDHPENPPEPCPPGKSKTDDASIKNPEPNSETKDHNETDAVDTDSLKRFRAFNNGINVIAPLLGASISTRFHEMDDVLNSALRGVNTVYGELEKMLPEGIPNDTELHAQLRAITLNAVSLLYQHSKEEYVNEKSLIDIIQTCIESEVHASEHFESHNSVRNNPLMQKIHVGLMLVSQLEERISPEDAEVLIASLLQLTRELLEQINEDLFDGQLSPTEKEHFQLLLFRHGAMLCGKSTKNMLIDAQYNNEQSIDIEHIVKVSLRQLQLMVTAIMTGVKAG